MANGRDANEPVIVGTLAAYKAWTVLKAAFVPVDPVVFTETFLRAMAPTILGSVEPGRAFAFDVDPRHVFVLQRDAEDGGRPYIASAQGSSGRRTYLREETRRSGGSNAVAGAERAQRPGTGEADAPVAEDREQSRLVRSATPRVDREQRRREIYRFLRG